MKYQVIPKAHRKRPWIVGGSLFSFFKNESLCSRKKVTPPAPGGEGKKNTIMTEKYNIQLLAPQI